MFPDEREQWLDAVCDMIRWRRARPVVRQELADHMEDQFADCRAQGLSEAEAARQTVVEMGDTIEVGTALDRAYRPAPDWPLLGLTALIVVVGMVFQTLAGREIEAGLLFAYPVRTVWPHLLPGLFCLLAGYFLDYTVLYRYTDRLLAVLVGAAVPCMVVSSWNSYMTVLYLCAAVLYCGVLCHAAHGRWDGVLHAALYPCVLLVLLLQFPMRGASFIGRGLSWFGMILLLCAVLFWVTGWRTGFGFARRRVRLVLGLGGLSAVGVAVALLLRSARVQARLAVLCDPWQDMKRTGWQACIAQLTLRGETFGGTSAAAYLTDPQGDYLLTWMIGRFGWGMLAAVAALYLSLLLLCVRQYRRQTSLLARLTVLAVTVLFALQTFFFFAGNLGWPIVYHFTLPLFSNGGTLLCIDLFLMGLLLSVARTGALHGASDAKKASVLPKKHRFFARKK